jgi:hypothetical protein
VAENGGYEAMLAIPHDDMPGLFVFLADSSPREERADRLRGLTIARHTQLQEATNVPNLVTLGVATEGTPTPGRSHDYVFIGGELRFADHERRARDMACGPLPTAFIDQARQQLQMRSRGVPA